MEEPLGFEAVRHELRDRDEGDLVFGGELLEPWTLCRGSVFAEDLADHAGGRQLRETGEIDSRFGVADPLEYAAFAGAQWKDVAAMAKIAGRRLRIRGDANGRRAILGADAGRHTVFGR